MKNFNLCAAAVALLTLVSCAKENEVPSATPDNGEKMAVTLKMASPADSRSIEAPAGADKVVVSSGTVFFLNATNDVLDVGNLTAMAATPAGQLFPGISKSATQVFIVANSGILLPAELSALKACATKDGIQNLTALITSQQNTHLNVIAVNTIDTSTPYVKYDGIIRAQAAPSTTFEALVLLAPVLSRIQFADILTADPNIVSFKLASINIDGYYPSFYMAFDKGGSGTPFTVNQDGAALNLSPYKLYDKPTAPVADGGDKKITAAEAKGASGNLVWGYQTSPTIAANSAKIPRIIVELTDVVIKNPAGGTDITLPKKKYLTITGYMAGATPVANFEAGKVYNIPAGQFTFTFQDLDDVPNPLKQDVMVTVEVKPWAIVGVTPQL
ncbi:MAG: hypothetical protein RRY33_03310 [Alistipes sp.]